MDMNAYQYIEYDRHGIKRRYKNEWIVYHSKTNETDMLLSTWKMCTEHHSAIVHHSGPNIRYYYSNMTCGRKRPSCCSKWSTIFYPKPERSGYYEYNVENGDLYHGIKKLDNIPLEEFKRMVASMYNGTGSNFILFNTELTKKPAIDDELFFDIDQRYLIDWLKEFQ